MHAVCLEQLLPTALVGLRLVGSDLYWVCVGHLVEFRVGEL